MGQLSLAAGDQEGAIRAYANVVEQHPKSKGAFVGMAEALLALNRLEQARKAVDKAMENGANDGHAYHVNGRIYLGQAKFFRALRALQKADRLIEKDAEILADLGLAQLGTRSITRAEKSFKDSLRRKRLPRAQEGMARLLLARKKYRDAEIGRAHV